MFSEQFQTRTRAPQLWPPRGDASKQGQFDVPGFLIKQVDKLSLSNFNFIQIKIEILRAKSAQTAEKMI